MGASTDAAAPPRFLWGWDRVRTPPTVRWRVPSPALSVARWLHISASDTFSEAPNNPGRRVSPIRFGVLAFLPWVFPSSSRLKRWFASHPDFRGLPTASFPGQHVALRRFHKATWYSQSQERGAGKGYVFCFQFTVVFPSWTSARRSRPYKAVSARDRQTR
jgi:hypothetical protein